jgi:hypothetical protein
MTSLSLTVTNEPIFYESRKPLIIFVIYDDDTNIRAALITATALAS